VNNVKIELEWSYKPSDYFEEKIVLDRENYCIEIENGRIIAEMDANFFDSITGLYDLLTRKLKDYFRGALPIRWRVFEISIGSINRKWPNRRQDTALQVQVAELIFAGENADLYHTDTNGKATGDTRRARIEATKTLAELSSCQAPTDSTVRTILDSFDAAVRYPGSELVYLFEVFAAVQTRFRGEGKARKVLGIHRKKRSRLTKLADEEPLNQGRHRGKFAGKLRDATANELNEARTIARDMYEKYLNYLNNRDL